MTPHEKWLSKTRKTVEWNDPVFTSRLGWNAASKQILRMLKRRNRELEGNWQHEDIEFFMEDIWEMIDK